MSRTGLIIPCPLDTRINPRRGYSAARMFDLTGMDTVRLMVMGRLGTMPVDLYRIILVDRML